MYRFLFASGQESLFCFPVRCAPAKVRYKKDCHPGQLLPGRGTVRVQPRRRGTVVQLSSRQYVPGKAFLPPAAPNHRPRGCIRRFFRGM